jgi:hypothetical protein
LGQSPFTYWSYPESKREVWVRAHLPTGVIMKVRQGHIRNLVDEGYMDVGGLTLKDPWVFGCKITQNYSF